MTTETECQAAGTRLLGSAIAGVQYVGLRYGPGADVRWDYGDWHWPEVGVELTTTSGARFHAIWDSTITHFELTFAEGPISERWLPSRPEADEPARTWDVTTHPRWADVVGRPVDRFDVTLFAPDDPPVRAPVAVRLVAGATSVWLIAAAPRDANAAHEGLAREDVYLGHDEVIVVFGDDRARLLGVSLGG